MGLPIKINLPSNFFEAEPKELVISESKKKLWAVLLDLLYEFDRVCKKNNIAYYLDGGTLLGAIRHKGFIPWDDDVDVIMTRPEYERLCAIASDEFNSPYFFQTNKSDPGSAHGHGQLRNSLTTGILKTDMFNGVPIYRYNQGIFLDVFVMDEVPDDSNELAVYRQTLSKLKSRMYRWKRLLYGFKTIPWVGPRLSGFCAKLLGLSFLAIKHCFHVDMVSLAADRFDMYASRYNGMGMKRLGKMTTNPIRPERQLFDRSLFERTQKYMFEGFEFPGPSDYKTYLGAIYGNWEDHVVGGSAHGTMIVDVDRPYTYYL